MRSDLTPFNRHFQGQQQLTCTRSFHRSTYHCSKYSCETSLEQLVRMIVDKKKVCCAVDRRQSNE